MPFADSGSHVIRAGSDAALAAGVTALPTPDLPADDWTDANQLARTVLGEVAETARVEAQAQGYAVGWAQGRRDAQAAASATADQVARAQQEAEARREDEHRAAVQALRQAADQVRGLLTGLCTAVEEQGTEVALALTETLLGQELSDATDADVVRRALRLMPTVPTATVRLHPAVAASPAVKELTDAGLTVVGDASLDRDDALVESDGTVTDLRISTAMDRVREALR
jgi:flagellar assembly protein FliH